MNFVSACNEENSDSEYCDHLAYTLDASAVAAFSFGFGNPEEHPSMDSSEKRQSET
jgi:hypothetical protein